MYYVIKLWSLSLENLNPFGLGTFTGSIISLIILSFVLFFLGRKIWVLKTL